MATAKPVEPVAPELADPEMVKPALAPVDPLDVTEEAFTEWDADELGWIVFRVPGGEGEYHRVPVRVWPAYARKRGF